MEIANNLTRISIVCDFHNKNMFLLETNFRFFCNCISNFICESKCSKGAQMEFKKRHVKLATAHCCTLDYNNIILTNVTNSDRIAIIIKTLIILNNNRNNNMPKTKT